ncbi:glycosyltransferase family 1 protein, partial [candidate division KSB1 bacterium]
MRKVIHLTSVHPVFDVRIFHKEVKTLVKAGYDVTLIAQHNKEEVVDGIRIVSLPKPRNRFERMTKVVWRLFRLALKEKADVYHFHDPELIPVGLVLRLFGKKVIYDVHEDVPQQILTKDWIGNPIVRKIISLFFKEFENLSCVFFNGIVAATPDIAKKFPSQKTITLRNFPILELIDKANPLNIDKQKPIIIYAGGLTKIRGIKEIIQSMEFVGDKAELWLLGKWENEEFKKECENLKGWRYTKNLGLKALEEVYVYLKSADIGLHCVYKIKRYMVGLPIKVFEYAAARLPIIISDSAYWRNEFDGCALFVDPKNPKDIASKILQLLEYDKLRSKLAKRGRKIVLE